jgi:hypothetical protein
MPSPGLMALAAYLEAEGRECAVLDATALAVDGARLPAEGGRS